jgi:hypothetical protein
MPLAHPTDLSISRNYSEPVAVISFAVSKPGEEVADFNGRRSERGLWGQPGQGRHGVELAFTRESAEVLLELLVGVVGRNRAGELVDRP